ncbi:basic leucine zipper transcriptional factor ATF-like isoform X2 [Numida meleagris]|uniref:basic leucine zipper transcriptional factor ATF-like isoform X2 n=1 Tax=Numida meleagris TaxID=8996 RepID=UPI000B3D90A3|nr:basic leucine zipper transcriptional factor ATF-like isoform X2 [Numida meleagris]
METSYPASWGSCPGADRTWMRCDAALQKLARPSGPIVFAPSSSCRILVLRNHRRLRPKGRCRAQSGEAEEAAEHGAGGQRASGLGTARAQRAPQGGGGIKGEREKPGTPQVQRKLRRSWEPETGAMPHSSDSSDSSISSQSPPPSKQDSSDDMRKVQRREKNRIAAQKSRLRQTQKADTLHLESEDLERQNAALRREIKQLTEEMKHFTSVLSSHEPLCSILASPPPPPPEVLYAAHSFHQPHISSPRFQH